MEPSGDKDGLVCTVVTYTHKHKKIYTHRGEYKIAPPATYVDISAMLANFYMTFFHTAVIQ